jgi:uncharacterized SAM-binding protein YcdF (DUF218 family)
LDIIKYSLLLILIGSAGFYLSRGWWLPWVGCRLATHTSLHQAPDFYVLLLGGLGGERAEMVGELYRELGRAPIVFGQTEPTPFELSGVDLESLTKYRNYLTRVGIAPGDIIVAPLPYVTSTRDEAERIIPEILRLHVGTTKPRVLVVTNWSHTSRAKWIFEKVAKDRLDIEAFAADTDRCKAWWTNEEETVRVILEHTKWIFYLAHYRTL